MLKWQAMVSITCESSQTLLMTLPIELGRPVLELCMQRCNSGRFIRSNTAHTNIQPAMASLAQQTLTRPAPCAARGAFRRCAPAQRIVRRSATAVEAEVKAEQTPALEKTGANFKPVLDIEAIKGVLPHR
jgi:hypothetical protein